MKTSTVVATLVMIANLGGAILVQAVPAPPVSDTEQAAPAKPGSRDEIAITLKVPIFSPLFAKVPVALANDEPIYLEELNKSLATVHAGMGQDRQVKKQDFADILRRLITTRLIIQEARNIGLDQQEEFTEVKKDFTAKLLRETVMKEYAKDIQSEPAEVEKLYQQLTSEWRLTSLNFGKEDDAKKFLAAVREGGNFAELAGKVVGEGKAKSEQEGKYFKRAEMHPEMVKKLDVMKSGEISEVTPLTNGFLVYRLDDVRHPDSPQHRDEAERQTLTATRLKALEGFRDQLMTKHLVQNEKLIESLDFEAKEPGFAQLLKDTRVLAELKGEPPVTISDLAKAVDAKFYHGVEQAIADKKVNKEKKDLLYDILAKRALEMEAREQGIDKREEYLVKVRDFEDSILFGTFINKVVRPDIKLANSDLDAYYTANLDKYTFPAMLRFDGIAFTSMNYAQAAIDKLRKGMDYGWFKDNAEGKVPSGTPGLIHFEEAPVLTTNLAEDLQKALTGVLPDEYRLYAGANGKHYVIHVREVIPARTQTFQEVADDVRKVVYYEKLNKAVDEWGTKLREATDVRIFVQFDK